MVKLDDLRKDIREVITVLEGENLEASNDLQSLIKAEFQSGQDSSLINSIIDILCEGHFSCKSPRIIQVLSYVREPQDKHLCDKICTNLKSSNHKLDAINLLAELVCVQPPWLHRIAKHSLFHALIKQLKHDTSLPLLMVGTLTLTALLPSIPVAVGPSLNDVFEAFCRLVAIKLKKPDDYPDSHMLHFQVAVYSLFNRLYGMYPCNLLTFLRSHYEKKDPGPFNHTIKPMLQHVRMHPLLITCSKNQELMPDRWKRKEIHDIVMECAHQALDLSEASAEELTCPILPSTELPLTSTIQPTGIIDSPYAMTMSPPVGVPSIGHPAAIRPSQIFATGTVGPITGAALVGSVENDVYNSPSLVCGLSTPPPGGQHAAEDEDTTPPMRQTPRVGVDSPVYVQAVDKDTSDTRSKEQSNDALDKSGEFLGSHHSSRASDMGVADGGDDQQHTMFTYSHPPPPPMQPLHPLLPPTSSLPIPGAIGGGGGGMAAGGQPSLKDLEQIVGSMETDYEEPDDEVSAITTEEAISAGDHASGDHTSGDENALHSDDDSYLPSHRMGRPPVPVSLQTAKSVKTFMQNYNRIRFNSLHAIHSTQNQSKAAEDDRPPRPRSCPKIDVERRNEPNTEKKKKKRTVVICEHCKTAIATNKDYNINNVAEPADRGTVESGTIDNAANDAAREAIDKGAVVEEASVGAAACNEAQDTPLCVSPQSPDDVANRAHFVYPLPAPFVQLLKIGLPFSHITGTSSNGAGSMSTPPSVFELLEQHLRVSSDMFERQQVKDPHNTHIHILQNQLLFERSKRELYVKRNRRLLRSIINQKTLQEEAEALKSQLQQQEEEYNKLTNMLHEFRDIKAKEIDMKDQQIEALHKSVREYKIEINELRDKQNAMTNELCAEQTTNAELMSECRDTQNQLTTTAARLQYAQQQANKVEACKKQVINVNRDLLLAGELLQKFQHRLSHHLNSEGSDDSTLQNGKEGHGIMLTAAQFQLTRQGNELSNRTRELDIMKAKLREAEEHSREKDKKIQVLNNQIDDIRSVHKEKVQALNDLYGKEKRIVFGLEQHIMQLQSEVMELEHTVDETKRECREALEAAAPASAAAAAAVAKMKEEESVTRATEVIADDCKELMDYFGDSGALLANSPTDEAVNASLPLVALPDVTTLYGTESSPSSTPSLSPVSRSGSAFSAYHK